MPGRKGGLFYSGSRTYRFCKPPCGTVCVPLAKWCKDNNFTTDQARTLFKRKLLLGMRHKGRIYVAVNPEITDINKEYQKYKQS